MELSLSIIDQTGATLSAVEATDEVVLVHRCPYGEGDRIEVRTTQPGHVVMTLDAAVAPTLVYLREGTFSFAVPFGQRSGIFAPHAFAGDLHRLQVRRALDSEIAQRRNLAFNPLDDHTSVDAFPHASANVETRGEAAFAARNAIDGEKASDGHGGWPYTSWGINQNPQAALTLDFGRPVSIDEVVVYLRADFPHDAWWQRATVSFSDGTSILLDLKKSGAAQSFSMESKVVEWVRLDGLVKADDPSPFPALTQIEVWGADRLDRM